MDDLTLKTDIISTHPDIVIFRIGGYVDQSNCEEIDNSITRLLDSGKYKIVCDLSNLSYMSSAGWGVFVGRLKNLRDRGGNMKIAAMQPQVQDVFEILEFYHIIEDFITVGKAVASYNPSAVSASQPSAVTIPAAPDPASAKPEPPKPQEQEVSADDKNEPFYELLNRNGLSLNKGPGNSTDNNVNTKTEPIARPVLQRRSARSNGPQSQQSSAAQLAAQPNPQPVKSTVVQAQHDLARAPLAAKIKALISKYPLVSVREIQKILRQKELGYTRIGYFKLRKVLKSLKLATREQRYRFYKST